MTARGVSRGAAPTADPSHHRLGPVLPLFHSGPPPWPDPPPPQRNRFVPFRRLAGVRGVNPHKEPDMPRYVAHKPLFVETPLWDDQREGGRPAISVDGEKQVDTGLLSADGAPIFRVPDPIGFGRS
jgi:hypothetical protein